MAIFHFRLQPLLEQRLDAQKRAEEALAESQKVLLEAKRVWRHLQQEQEQLAALILTRRQKLVGTNAIGGMELERRNDDITALSLHLQTVRESVFSQQVVVDEAEGQVEESRSRVAECSQRTETLTKYRDKLEEEFKRESARKEELELDEIGNVLYLNRNQTQ